MILSLLAPQPDQRRVRAFAPLAHPEYPIEQTVRGRDPAMHALLVRSARRLCNRTDDVRYLEEPRGVRILGRSEGTLKHATARLAGRQPERVTVELPRVRYIHGAQVLEPWMDVLVNVPERYGRRIEQDFDDRRGTIRRVRRQGSAAVLEGEAPLASLLGYADWLQELTEAAPNVATWLSRYLPLDRGPHAA